MANGRDPIGISQPPGPGRAYPFTAPSEDIDWLLADFYLNYDDPTCVFAWPLQIAWLYGFGATAVAAPAGFPAPTHSHDLVVTDANGAVVFDSTASDYAETPWGQRYLVIQWTTATAVCRCVQYLTWGLEDTPRDYDLYIVPAHGRLDARTYERLPGRLRSLSVAGNRLTGNILVKAGYNLELVGAPGSALDGGRAGDLVNLNAVPGAGRGRAPACTDDAAFGVRTINKVRPDNAGNFILTAEDCLRVNPPVIIEEPLPSERVALPAALGLGFDEAQAALQISNDCQPCCVCEDYVRTYRGLKRVWDFWQSTATAAETARDVYETNRTQWLDQLDCRLNHPLQLVVQHLPECQVSVAGSYCNTTICCANPLELRFTLQYYQDGVLTPWPATATILEAVIDNTSTGSEQPYTPDYDNTFGIVRFYFDSAEAQSRSLARFRLCLPCRSNDGIKVTMTSHPKFLPAHGIMCGLPASTIPKDIQDLWDDAGILDKGQAAVALDAQNAPLISDPAVPECGCQP